MSEGELYKKIQPYILEDSWGDIDTHNHREIARVLDEAKKDFYKIINEDVPEDQNDPESLYELMKMQLKSGSEATKND